MASSNMGSNIIRAFEAGFGERRQREDREKAEEERKLRLQILKNEMARVKEQQSLSDFEAKYNIRQGKPGPSVPGVEGSPGGMEDLLNARQGTPQVMRSPIGGLEAQNFQHTPLAIPEHLGGGTITPQTQQELQAQKLQDFLAQRRLERMTAPPKGYSSSPLGIFSQDTGEIATPAQEPSMTPYQQESLDLRRQAVRPRLLSQEEEAQQVRIAGAKAAATQAAKPVLSSKELLTAKGKMDKLRLAKTQIKQIQDKFDQAKGISAGPVTGLLPTPSGQAFDKAVDAFRQTFVALTRTPGVGQMSDFETRLSQAALPSRSDYESVTQQAIDQLNTMVQELESGYSELLSGAQGTSTGGQQPVYAVNPQTGERIMSMDGGQTWQPAQ